MAAGLRGDLSSIRAMKRSVAALPITLRHAVAADGAPALTAATREAFAAGRSVYRTPAVTQHLLTNAEVVRMFLDRPIAVRGEPGEPGTVEVG